MLVKLTVGYESNLHRNIAWKKSKYKELMRQQKQYYQVKFMNISLSSIGVFAKEFDTFLGMLDNFGFDYAHKLYCVRNMMKIASRT